MAITHNENPTQLPCMEGAWCVCSPHMPLHMTRSLYIGVLGVFASFINLQYLVSIWVQIWMFSCWRSSLVWFILRAAKWLLAVLVTTSGWHWEPGNQAAGQTEWQRSETVCWRLSQNYPWVIPQNYAIPVWPRLLMGLGRRRALDQCVCCTGEIWMEQCWCLCHGAFISVWVCVCMRVCACMCAL